MIFAILHFYNFILVIDSTVQNNDNEISLRFKPIKLSLIGLKCNEISLSLIYTIVSIPSIKL